MSVAWTINGSTPAALGLELVGGSFRTGTPGELTFRRLADFDASPLYSFGDTVSVVRDGTTFFSGKVISRPCYGRASAEGQTVRIVDAWQDLEDTIYQEPWSVGTGSVDYPIAILGIDDAGDPITTGDQVEAAINFAIAAGVDLQLGTVPTGLPLWPMEVRNISCAEVLRISMRLHPDWVPWIDHATTPPTIHVTARADMTTKTLDVDGGDEVESFDMERRDDLKPAAVIITYQTASIIDGVTYRNSIIDKWPAAGPDSGPRVASTVIELAGGQMQFQKSRIQTRALPTTSAEAKTWLKLKYPHLKDVPDGDMTVSGFAVSLLADAETLPDPVNPNATRLAVDDATDLPRELVRGTIEDWMRVKVGKIRVVAVVEAAGGASATSKAAIAQGCPPLTVTATDATTKIYKGVTQWVAPEVAPEGIAQAVYESLETYQFEGSLTLTQEDVTADVWHGRHLNLTGGLSEWSTMEAPIHQASFDIGSGSITLSFGPAPYLAAEDFLEIQRMLRGRAPTWMSAEERTSNELGATDNPGSKGDTVGGFDQPETVQDPAATPTHPWLVAATGAGTVTVKAGKVLGMRTTGTSASPWYVNFASYAGGTVTVTAAGYIYAKVATSQTLIKTDSYEIDTGNFATTTSSSPTSITVVFSTSAPSAVSGGSSGEVWIPIAQVDLVSSVATVVDQIVTGNPTLFVENVAIG